MANPPASEENPVNCCHTQPEQFKFSYTWVITDFSLLTQENGKCLKTTFSTKCSDRSRWSIQMYPKGITHESQNNISLFLHLMSSSKNNKVTAKFEFIMFNAKNQKIKSESSSIRIFQPGSSWGFHKFISRGLVVESLPNDKLTICCELLIVGDIVNTYGSIEFKVPRCKLSEDYSVLLGNEKFSDVTLSVEGRECKVHKIVLAARSPVFQSMFEQEMYESKYNIVHITDIDYEVLQEMLKYIYTGKTSRLQEMAYRLLAAADKYALDELQLMCEEALCRNLSIDNVTKILILADLHSAYQLKTHAINFINDYTLEVMGTSEWQNMIQTHPHLIAEAYRASKTPTRKRKLEETTVSS